MNGALAAFKLFYESFDRESLNNLQNIYSDEILFIDPIHEIRGIERLERYFENMCGDLTYCRFKFVDEMIQPGRACFKWEMYYRHPKIKKNAPLHLSGTSFIKYSQKIDTHEDFYDMGAMLYEHIPVLGGAIRLLKSKITNGI
ncbi:MAG: hypothetical protein ACI82Z_000313 [Cellvibrionaceae bacterium]|jgi:hypothetical protein